MKVVFSFLLLCAVCGCQPGSGSDNSGKSKQEEPGNHVSLLDSAKNLIARANEYAAMGVKGTITVDEANMHIKPLMKQYELIYAQLSPQDTLEIAEYRLAKINELIDMQMKYMK